MAYASLNGPAGWVTVFVDDGAVVALEWGRAAKAVPGPGLDAAVSELERYFDGRPLCFSVPLRPAGGPFRQQVWRRLAGLPWGSTATYGALAAELGTAPRAIARACAANPIPIIIPCHRVVSATGGLGGYSGGDGVATKAALLALEGVGLPLIPRPAGIRNQDKSNGRKPMPMAIRFHETGGPEVLRYEHVEVGQPGPGQIRLRQTAIGLNYIDVYHRNGLYPVPSLPSGIGLEAAAAVEAVGEGVETPKVGQRVAYAGGPVGAYAEERLMPADRVVVLPGGISDKQAAAMMLQGMTAQYLLRRTYPVKAGDVVLIHAAAGGVGLIACQWAKHLGATVIGTVGSDEKAELARANGCDHPIVYSREDFVAEVKRLTGGRGVAVVYDSVGASTFMGSLDCLEPMGMMVSFGNASGPVPAFEPGLLAAKGSLFFTRPTLMTYTADPEDLRQTAADLFAVVQEGAVKIHVNREYPLAEAAQAHRDLEGRKTTGSTILLP